MYIINDYPICGREIVIYGGGQDGRLLLGYFGQLKIPVAFIVETNPRDKSIMNLTVAPPRVLNSAKHFVIIASSRYAADMATILNERGFLQGNDYSVCNVWENFDEFLDYYINHSPLSLVERENLFYASCEQLRRNIGVISGLQFQFCCFDGSSADIERPTLHYDKNSDTVEDYIDRAVAFRTKILADIKNGLDEMPEGYFCKGCYNIKRRMWPSDERIQQAEIGYYPSPCNCRCVYCRVASHNELYASTPGLTKTAIELFEGLKKRGVLRADHSVNVAAGEISIHNDRDLILDFCKGHITSFSSNCIVFNDRIAHHLEDGKSYVMVSLDAGTAETYRKIKGVDAFHRVLDNIKKYMNHGVVQIKYIVSSFGNNNEKDFDEFVRLLASMEKPPIAIVATDVHDAEKKLDKPLLAGAERLTVKLQNNGIRTTFFDKLLSVDLQKELAINKF